MSLRVNFLVIGTQKGGTTALAKFLGSHPDICMAPEKEVHHFDAEPYEESPAAVERYHSRFPNYTGQPLVGEATPIYMYLPHIAPRMNAYSPALKLIVVLRNPIDRAYSQYRMSVRLRKEFLPFSWALRAEPGRLNRHRNNMRMGSPLRKHSYVDRGYYSRQISHLLAHFPRHQLLFLRHEDLDFLKFHRMLLPACTHHDEPGWPDWGWTISERLDAARFEAKTSQAQALIASRAHRPLWGFKDPRATLFLPLAHAVAPSPLRARLPLPLGRGGLNCPRHHSGFR